MIKQRADEITGSTSDSSRFVRESESRKVLARDINYLRDVTLFWPFVLFLLFGVPSVFSAPNRQLGIRILAAAAAALLLSKERLFLFLVALGFIALQSAIALILRPWDWALFAFGSITGAVSVLATRHWRKRKLSYHLPPEFGAVDMLLSFASICASLFVLYLIRM